MADLKDVLLVESDAVFADQIKSTLEQFGTRVEIIDDGAAALARAKATPPELILLCVELSKMSGYSICNKLKKNAALKKVPLLIMSAEATPDIFEQHKKLKTRAEEYLIKPFEMNELLQKVSNLIDLAAGDEGGDGDRTTILQGSEASSLIAQSTQAQSMDELAGLTNDISDMEEPTRVTMDGDLPAFGEPPAESVDSEIEAATNAAFAALELGDEVVEQEQPILITATAGTPDVEAPDVEPPEPAESIEIDTSDAAFEVESPAMAASDEVLRAAGAKVTAEAVEPHDIEDYATSEPLSKMPVAEDPAAGDEHALGALQAQIETLERENRRLNDELQNVNAGASSSGFSRDRELLSLKEVINKKEKEILDLKDDIDAKERQILDHKDKVRELERKARDTDDKFLHVEREMVSSRERIEALNADKEKLVEREAGIKKRLEQAKEEIDKSHAENEEIKQRAEAEIEQLREQHAVALQAARDEAAQALEAARDEHRSQSEAAAAEHQAEMEAAAAANEAQKAELVAEHEQAMDQQAEVHQAAMAEAKKQHDDETSELRASQAEAVERLRAESDKALKERDEQHQTAQAEAAEAHASEQARLKQEHAEALAAMEQAYEDSVKQKDAEHATAMEALRTEHQAELDRLRGEHDRAAAEAQEQAAAARDEAAAEHQAEIEELKRQHGDQVAGMKARHAQETDELKAKADAQRSEMEQAIAERDADLQTAREAIAERDGQISEFEKKVQTYEEQLLAAYNKIKHDEHLAEKAQRALAIGISLLEEQKKVSAMAPGAAAEEGDVEQAQDQAR